MPCPAGNRDKGRRVFQESSFHLRRAWWGGLLALAGFVGLCALASAAGAALTPGRPGSPLADRWPGPALLVGLDVLPGLAAWLVWRRIDVGLHRKKAALRLWGWGLPGRALWAAAAGMGPGIAHGPWEAGALLVLGGLTLLCFRAFWPLQRFAAAMLLPYMACIGVAAWLSASV